MRANAHVTTTSSITGWEIESYLGVVASHVVAGTGLGSDILAGFSDLFGGRSGTYQKQLASIYDEAIAQLYRKATYLGGNWIVGLRVDIDEVSGKGTQMFMVTAMGTAVRASAVLTTKQSKVAGRAAASDLQKMQRRLEIVLACRTDQLSLDNETWDFLIDQRVHEAAPAVLTWAAKVQGPSPWELVEEVHKRRPLAFFSAVTPEIATGILHDALCGEGPAVNAAINIMRSLSLVSLEASLRGLRSTNRDLRRRVVQVLEAHQQTYVEDDLAIIDDLIREIPQLFGESPEVVQGKGLLGGKKDKWICESCGNQNNIDHKRCGKCARDVQGFLVTETIPEKAVSILRDRRKALAALFGADDGSQKLERARTLDSNGALIG